MLICVYIESSCRVRGSFRKFCVSWQHRALLHITELKIIFAVLVALLLLSQRCTVFVICSLALDQERLQGSSSQMYMRTLIKFYFTLSKSALECYQLVKESLGPHASSYETVH